MEPQGRTLKRDRPAQIISRRSPAARTALALVALASFIGGCGVTMEDGYKPHSLDASADMRRSYYASPFTDNANAAGGDHDSGLRLGH
ncbi:MAG TPA: hypothetical protein VG326_06870 [Tepidisphaeraceae bacterium]|jgi:hypothetical protein|nr:hypothetical protein [Tepidisphaeraceae bacterium]